MSRKVSWKKYYEPTPKNVRKFADSVLAASVFAGGYATYIESKPWVGFVIIGVGALAKFASNFLTDTQDAPEKNTDSNG